ncbi:MAG: acetolactate synthase large subunit [Smithellaceae bacterium]|jgi:acetolactate synthase-1/2/3 large subunit
MNGAEIILKTARDAGVEICFANAGTTELPLVAAFDTVSGLRPVLGLFEGVCTGAADGFGRMTQKPAMTLLHLGPGFANGIANLHNARRARTPVFNVIGEHASWHRAADPPLNMDIASLTKTVSGWQRISRSVNALAQDTADALAASLYGQISTIIVPADYQWSEYKGKSVNMPHFEFDGLDQKKIEEAARLMKKSTKPALVLGGRALRKPGLATAAKIKAATGCDLLMVTFPAYFDSGEGFPLLKRIPYFPEQASALLGEYDSFILAGAEEPVAFFGYKDGKSHYLAANQKWIRIDTEKQDAAAALQALAESSGASSTNNIGSVLAKYALPEIPSGALNSRKLCAVIAALQPENCIIVDEGVTASAPYYPLAPMLKPYSHLTLTGGAIGMGMPCALGAALACPDRQVINIEADGSAMYTVQALWSQAHEKANVITLICSNRKYFTIEFECRRAGFISLGAAAQALINMDQPTIDWVKLSQGMNVPAVSVGTAEELVKELKAALNKSGPHLIEVVLG